MTALLLLLKERPRKSSSEAIQKSSSEVQFRWNWTSPRLPSAKTFYSILFYSPCEDSWRFEKQGATLLQLCPSPQENFRVRLVISGHESHLQLVTSKLWLSTHINCVHPAMSTKALERSYLKDFFPQVWTQSFSNPRAAARLGSLSYTWIPNLFMISRHC